MEMRKVLVDCSSVAPRHSSTPVLTIILFTPIANSLPSGRLMANARIDKLLCSGVSAYYETFGSEVLCKSSSHASGPKTKCQEPDGKS